MGLFGPSRRELQRELAELRNSIENPTVPISSANIFAFLGAEQLADTGESVSIDSAMGVPAVWAAVNFLSGTLASLPLHLYRRRRAGRERVMTTGRSADALLAHLLHDAASDEMTSFEWRKYHFDQVFTQGRGISFIERNGAGQPLNLWPLNPRDVKVRLVQGRRFYDHQDGSRRTTYDAGDVIDTTFCLKPDKVSHRSPILTNANVIGLAQQVTRYGARFFGGGGVPPFVIEGPFQSPGALQRASDDLAAAVRAAAAQNRQALALPAGHTVKPVGTDPEKAQMVEAQRFIIEQISRIYALPPTFLQDLTHGTFANTEQQDLHFTKHTLTRWVEQFEQELNLKLFGRGVSGLYVEMNIDGLLRGDFKTRMDGYAAGIQNAILKPNEARVRENLSPDPAGDVLMIQGATVPVGSQPSPPAAQAEGDDDGS